MTFFAGDDSTITYPVTDTNGGTLDFPATVLAHTSAGAQSTITGDWQGTAIPHPDPPTPGATIRDLEVPLVTLTAGLWGLVLAIDDAEDLFLGNVFIQ